MGHKVEPSVISPDTICPICKVYAKTKQKCLSQKIYSLNFFATLFLYSCRNN